MLVTMRTLPLITVLVAAAFTAMSTLLPGIFASAKGHRHTPRPAQPVDEHKPPTRWPWRSSMQSAGFERTLFQFRPHLHSHGNSLHAACNCSNFTTGLGAAAAAAAAAVGTKDLCKPVSVNASRAELLVWYVPGDGHTWQHYDWTKVTTVAVLDDIDTALPQDLVCFAHAHGVRVVYVIQYGCWSDNCGWVANRTARTELIRRLTDKVQREKLDGINVDIEGLTDDQDQFTELVQDLVTSVRAICPTCQFSVDLPYIPQPVDSFTGYDWPDLAKAVDFLITMDYDMNDFGERGGFADANSPLYAVKHAVSSILLPTDDQHVPSQKIVLGFPWYAYYFRCDNSTPVAPSDEVKNPCYSHLPFTQSSSQHSLADAILNKLPNSSSGRLWDDEAQSPYFDFFNGTVRHRVRYDDSESIAIKCRYAKSQAVRGVAFWTANVDYGVPMPPEHENLEKLMWQSVVWPSS